MRRKCVGIATLLLIGVALFAAPFCGSVGSQPAPSSGKTAASKLPIGPAPYQALAIADRNGNVTMKVMAMSYVMRSVPDPDAKNVLNYYEPTPRLLTKQYTAEQIQVHGRDGKTIDAKRLRKLLRDEVPVLVSMDGKPVDPLHLRLYRDDALFLVLVNQPPQISRVPQIDVAPQLVVPEMARELTVVISGLKRNLVGLECTYFITITNGPTKLRNAALYAWVPEKMHLSQLNDDKSSADRRIMVSLGDLEPGAIRSEVLNLTATEKGDYRIKIAIYSDKEMRKEAETRTTVVDDASPKLAPPK